MKHRNLKKIEIIYSSEALLDDRPKINCNICDAQFHPHSPYERFCASCRKSSRVFKMSEWLPEHVIQF